MQPYGKEVAETIIKCRQSTVWRLGVDGEHEKDDFIIKDDGVYPVKGVASSSQEFLGAVWRPACELDAQDKSTWLQPSLPIPFNEKQLAAFFMHGNGWYVRDSFGAWEDGPDDAVFDSMIDPDDDISSLVVPEVKKAVSAAYDAYRAAECVVGQFDNTLACEAQQLDSVFWKAAVSLRTVELHEALRIAHKKANDAEAAWRKKMVNQLLAVEQVTDAPAVFMAPNRAAASTAPVLAKTIQQRNGRWLAQLEDAKSGRNPPSDADVYRKIQAAEGIPFETIKKGVAKAKKDFSAKYAEGNVKHLARGKKGRPELATVWKSGSGK